MKKLNKKNSFVDNTIEAFMRCRCVCSCSNATIRVENRVDDTSGPETYK